MSAASDRKCPGPAPAEGRGAGGSWEASVALPFGILGLAGAEERLRRVPVRVERRIICPAGSQGNNKRNEESS